MTLTSGLINVKPMAVGEAIVNGTLFRSVSTSHPVEVKNWLLGQLARVVHRVEAKVTVTDEREYIELSREIYKQFPTLRIEEMEEVFNGIIFGKYGKYYERLKAAEFIEAFRQHEAGEQRITAFENRHKVERYSVRITSTKSWDAVFTEVARRGYTLTADQIPKQGLEECYVNIEGGKYTLTAQPTFPAVQSAKQFCAPVSYKPEEQRARGAGLSANLRKELTVDPKVMAEYVSNSFPKPLEKPTGKTKEQ